jgi:hypothetical protein
MMNWRLALLLGFLGLVGICFLGWVACAWVLEAPYPWDWPILYRIQARLDRDLRELPQPEGFHLIMVITGREEERGPTKEDGCYYAGAYIVFGTTLPAQEAMECYVRALEAQGWRLANAESWEWFLVRAEQEELTISAQGPGPIIEMEPAYQQARERFPTFIYITLRYILPRVRGC